MYTALWLDYRLKLWALTSASRAVLMVAELLVVATESSRLLMVSYMNSERNEWAVLLWSLKVKDCNLSRCCQCAGDFVSTLSLDNFLQTLRTFCNIARCGVHTYTCYTTCVSLYLE